MRDFRGLLKLAQVNTPMTAAPGVATMVVRPAPTTSQPPIAKPVVTNATNFDTFTDDQKTLAKLLYDEARGHTADMPYIAAAVYNRSLGTDHVGEVIQPVAFSGMGPDRSFKSWSHRNDNDAEKAAWQEAMKQAMAIYADDYVPPTSATHFAMPNAVASWNNGKTMLPISGVAHRFYDDVRFERPWVATPMPVLTEQNMRKHKVAPGENFSKIAQKYGVPTSWIQAWNNKVDPKKLKVGSEILYVPLPAGYISSSATGKQAAKELEEIRKQRLNTTMNKGAMAYMAGFMSKCAEYGVDGKALLKTAGPSLRDRAAAGVPGASAKLRAQEEARAYRNGHPNPLGSLNEQKAYLRQQGSKELGRLTPEQRSKFWGDAQKFQANALRARTALASLAGGFGGLGLAGAAGLEGTGEALASKMEGRSTGSSLGRGAVAGGASYGLGKGMEAVGRYFADPVVKPFVRSFHKAMAPGPSGMKFKDRLAKELFFAKASRTPATTAQRNETWLRRRVLEMANHMRAAQYGEPAVQIELARLGESVRGHQTPDQILFTKVMTRSPELAKKNPQLVHRIRERLIKQNRFGTPSLVGGEYGYGVKKDVYTLAREIEEGARAELGRSGLQRANPSRFEGVGGPLNLSGKKYTFSELIDHLRNQNNDYIFKGYTSGDPLSRGSEAANFWFSHNPAVSAGYAVPEDNVVGNLFGMSRHASNHGFMIASPIDAAEKQMIYSRFTPHIATDDPAILRKFRSNQASGRLAGRSSAGNAYDYELVLNRNEARNAVDKGRRFFVKRTGPSSPDLPVLHGVEPVNGYDPGLTFIEMGPSSVGMNNPRLFGNNMYNMVIDNAFRVGQNLGAALR